MGLSRAEASLFSELCGIPRTYRVDTCIAIRFNAYKNFCTWLDESREVTRCPRRSKKSNWKILNASSSGNVAIVSNSRATNVFPLSSLLSGCDASANLSATKDHPETRNFDEKFVVPRLFKTCRRV